MAFTLTCQDALRLDERAGLKHIATQIYGNQRIDGTEYYLDNNQHDYDELPDADIGSVLGEIVNKADTLGVYLDLDPQTIDGVYVYSILRLAKELEHQYPELVSKFGEYDQIVNAMDGGKIQVSSEEYPKARLIANVIGLARNPVSGLPCVIIFF